VVLLCAQVKLHAFNLCIIKCAHLCLLCTEIIDDFIKINGILLK